MTITWSRATGYYESDLRIWCAAASRYWPVYRIKKLPRGWLLSINGTYVEGLFSTATLAKKYAQQIENDKPPYQTEEEHSFGQSDGWAGGVGITSDGRRIAWGVFAGESAAAEKEA